MKRRTYRWTAAALVLPVLIFRSLIPVGFMPMWGASGALELGLCPGFVDGATFIFAAADPHAHHHESHRSPSCPYALSATALPAPAIAAHVPAAVASEYSGSNTGISFFLSTITRVQMPRGPPGAA